MNTLSMITAAMLGIIGPLAVGGATWVLMEQTHRRDPGQLTGLMMKLFAGKMVVFGFYVAVMLGALALPPVPFVAGFTMSFIAVHLIEALCLRRLSNNA